MDSELLNINETAQFLHLKASTIRSWILHRRIPFVKLGRRVLLRRSDIEDLIARSVVPTIKAFAVEDACQQREQGQTAGGAR